MGTRSRAYPIALGGMMTAVAVVVMCLGTVIPVATYAAPVLCMLIGQLVLNICGNSIAWAWYGAVALLSLLLAPDKEAAAVFVFLGYYPIVKPWLDGRKCPWLWKGLLFNGATLGMYALLIHLLGMEQMGEEFAQMGMVMAILCLILGNITFFLLDILLGRGLRKRR